MKEWLKWFFHCLVVPREYSRIDGEIYVREWWSKPKELIQHMKEDHGWCQAEINDRMLEARKILKDQEGKGDQ